MSSYIHVNGELVPENEAVVHVRDRGFLYGDGLFETLRAYHGTVYAWDKHWRRFCRGSELIQLDHGLESTDVLSQIEATLEANNQSEAYIRFSVTRGRQVGRLAPTTGVPPTVVIMTEELPTGGDGGTPVWDAAATCKISTYRHTPADVLPPSVKSHNYLNGILAKMEARRENADEALLLDQDGFLTEGTVTNVFLVVDGILHTPSLDAHPVLPGVTRSIVLELAKDRDIPLEVGTVSPALLGDANEVFLTNTTWEVRPVRQIGDHQFETGAITTTLADAYTERVERLCYGR